MRASCRALPCAFSFFGYVARSALLRLSYYLRSTLVLLLPVDNLFDLWSGRSSFDRVFWKILLDFAHFCCQGMGVVLPLPAIEHEDAIHIQSLVPSGFF